MSIARKKWLIWALLLAPITCSGLDVIDVTETSRATISGSSLLEQLVEPFDFGGFTNLDVSQNATLQNQGVSKEQIDSVIVKTLKLSIVDPAAGQDFTFIESIAFYIESEGLPRKRIASGGPFMEGLTEVGLNVDEQELKPYVVAPSLTITTEVNGRRPSQETTIEASITLSIDINIAGACQ